MKNADQISKNIQIPMTNKSKKGNSSLLLSRGNILFQTFLAFYSILLIFLCYKVAIWEDESYTLYTTSQNIFKVFSLSYSFEGQPPFYFVLLAIWRKIDISIFFARFFSVICIFLSAYFFHGTLKLIYSKTSKWAVVLFMLNPFTIWAGLEIRLYSLLILLTILAIYSFIKVYFYNQNKYKVLFVIISICGIYTQYYFVFIIISLAISLLFIKGWKPFISFCLTCLIIAIIVSPNLLFAINQYKMHENEQYNLHDALTTIINSPFEFFLNTTGMPWNKVIRWSIRFVFLFIICYSFYHVYHSAQRKCEFKNLNIILISIVFCYLLFFVLQSSTKLIYQTKYLTIIYPTIYLIIIVFESLENKKIILYPIFCIYYITITLNVYPPLYIKEIDISSTVKYVEKIEFKEEPIFFRDKHLALVFRPYYKGVNKLVPIPEISFNYNYYRNEIKDTLELLQIINSYTIKKNSFILVNGKDQGFYAKEVSNFQLDKFLITNYTISIDTVISGKNDSNFLRVRRLIRKAN